MNEKEISHRITQDEAISRGFTVDTHVYPPFAYIGARFAPVESVECFTEFEEELLIKFEALRNGNTVLLDALMGMVGQFFYGDDMEGELSHAFMSAEEQAIAVLIAAGMAEEVERGKNSYRLLWSKLDARKQGCMT